VDVPDQTLFGDIDEALGNGFLPEAQSAPAKSFPSAIRTCRKDDLDRIAEIHKSQFLMPGALLAELSPALIAALYESFIDRSVFLVHVSDGRVDGFVLGGATRELARCRLSFVRHCGLWCVLEVLRRPRIWWLSVRCFAKLIRKLLPSNAAAAEKEFRLMSIAVAADAERKGIGTELVRRFEEAVMGSCRAYRLGVLKNNSVAIRFYENLDFRYVGESAKAWTLSKNLATSAAAHELRSP
jgi:ribosomal protein S18 acetylase RimI-like enzyme